MNQVFFHGTGNPCFKKKNDPLETSVESKGEKTQRGLIGILTMVYYNPHMGVSKIVGFPPKSSIKK